MERPENPRVDPDAAPTFPAAPTLVSFRRYVAHLVDDVASIVIALVLWTLIVVFATAMLPVGHPPGWVFSGGFVVTLVAIQIPYLVLTQRRRGQTLGKLLLGLRVVDAGLAVPRRGALVRRSVTLYIEWVYLIPFISMMGSGYRQRLGDRWGKTYVVRDEFV